MEIAILIVILFFVGITLWNKNKEQQLLATVTESHRGTKSERTLVLQLLHSGIPSQTIFHDLYLKKYNGRYCQIDLVVPTKVGILVFEVKDYSGWIFGTGYKPKWTQVLAYGNEKYIFTIQYYKMLSISKI
jgi:hypothetical protein